MEDTRATSPSVENRRARASGGRTRCDAAVRAGADPEAQAPRGLDRRRPCVRSWRRRRRSRGSSTVRPRRCSRVAARLSRAGSASRKLRCSENAIFAAPSATSVASSAVGSHRRVREAAHPNDVGPARHVFARAAREAVRARSSRPRSGEEPDAQHDERATKTASDHPSDRTATQRHRGSEREGVVHPRSIGVAGLPAEVRAGVATRMRRRPPWRRSPCRACRSRRWSRHS